MEFEPSDTIRYLRASEPGITAVDFVRRAVTQMQIADELSRPEDRRRAITKAVGWAALILESPTKMLAHFTAELDSLKAYDPVGYRNFGAVFTLARTLSEYDPCVYTDTIRSTTSYL